MLSINPNPSRFDIVNWINDTLLIHITKIQQLGSGAIYCHLLDAAYPERVPLNKVKWDAKLEVDFLHNFKILQTSFQVLHIEKFIEVEKLVKAKYQDNFQFIQWMYGNLFELIWENQSTYQPLKRRKYARINLEFLQEGKKNKVKRVNVTLNRNKENYQKLNHEEQLSSRHYMKNSVSSILTDRSVISEIPNKNCKQSSSKNNLFSSIMEPRTRKNSMTNSFYLGSLANQNQDDHLRKSNHQIHKRTQSSRIMAHKQSQSNIRKTKGISTVTHQKTSMIKQMGFSQMKQIANVSIIQSDEEQDPYAVI